MRLGHDLRDYEQATEQANCACLLTRETGKDLTYTSKDSTFTACILTIIY
jgi:hypothetical protein